MAIGPLDFLIAMGEPPPVVLKRVLLPFLFAPCKTKEFFLLLFFSNFSNLWVREPLAAVFFLLWTRPVKGEVFFELKMLLTFTFVPVMI